MLACLLILFTSMEFVTSTCFEAINTTDTALLIALASTTCTHISVLEHVHGISCTLLGEPIKSEICILPTLIYKKIDTNCSDRTNLTAEFGTDPCVTETFDMRINQYTICPFKKDANGTWIQYVVRVVLEDGSRRTLDNDIHSYVSYDSTRRMWMYIYGPGVQVPFVAGVCAIADPASCPCAELKPAVTGPTAHPVITNSNKVCADPMRVWIIWDKRPNESFSPDYPLSLQCLAGEWLLLISSGEYGLLTLAASCV